MGIEFYITRAEFWADNDDTQITSDEWLSYINSDNELRKRRLSCIVVWVLVV